MIKRAAHAFSMLNKYPYNNGHVMIAPYRHVADLSGLSAQELADMARLIVETKKALDKRLKPHGYNVGMNLGKTAGAGYDKHLHVHIVPRWTGDTNFM
ncbi:HIT family hydrolase, partial [Candidatus Woesearchaeota archaeon CG_4_10_14_0_2_um_filter_33_10]